MMNTKVGTQPGVRIVVILVTLHLDQDLFWLGRVSEEPDANTDTDDEGDDVGDDHSVHELVAPLGGFEHGVVAFVVRLDLPLFGRRDVGSRAPVPDEVGDRHGISFADGVDVDSRPVLLLVVILLLVIWTVWRRLGRVVGHVRRHPERCPTRGTVGRLSLGLSTSACSDSHFREQWERLSRC